MSWVMIDLRMFKIKSYVAEENDLFSRFVLRIEDSAKNMYVYNLIEAFLVQDFVLQL